MIASQRAQRLAHLASARFDLLIVGGGIVGAAIARDAVMRGLAVALVEQGDFAGGTSSKTSKLIHGGLRYLEQGRVHLVWESLRERSILRAVAPSLVQPLALMIPVYAAGRRPPWMISAGLTLYDLLSLGRGLGRHRMLSAAAALAREPHLRVDGLRAAGMYMDCQMDDARLCLANILQARRFGAVCSNYTRLVQWLRADGRLCGGLVEDLFSGRKVEVRAGAVINAAGPWADAVRRLNDARAFERLAPTKGIHLIVRRLARTALFVEGRADCRPLFILPWGQDYSLVGTTESAVDGELEDLRASPDEVGRLLEEVNRVLPGSRLTAEDVVATFAGARPLLAFSGAATTASREHRIEEGAGGLISVLGGKYTTARVMARQTVERVLRRGGLRGERSLTDQVHVIEPVERVLLDQLPELVRMVEPDGLSRLIQIYGAGALPILQAIGAEPALAEAVCPHHGTVAAEVVHAIQQEQACTVTDVMARRTRMAFSACQGRDALPTVEDLFERYGGLTPHQAGAQVEAYQRFLAAGLAFRRVAGDAEPGPPAVRRQGDGGRSTIGEQAAPAANGWGGAAAGPATP